MPQPRRGEREYSECHRGMPQKASKHVILSVAKNLSLWPSRRLHQREILRYAQNDMPRAVADLYRSLEFSFFFESPDPGLASRPEAKHRILKN